MSAAAFNKLHRDLQLEMVRRVGVFLLKCQRSDLTYRLFSMEKFYVEVVTVTIGREIVSIWGFEDVRRLEPYLSYIDIKDLLN